MDLSQSSQLHMYEPANGDGLCNSFHDTTDDPTALTNTLRADDVNNSVEEYQNNSKWSSGLFVGFKEYPHYMALQLGCCCCINAYVYARTVNAERHTSDICLESINTICRRLLVRTCSCTVFANLARSE
eukprot:349708-Hanusia_phi.AAC.1